VKTISIGIETCDLPTLLHQEIWLGKTRSSECMNSQFLLAFHAFSWYDFQSRKLSLATLFASLYSLHGRIWFRPELIWANIVRLGFVCSFMALLLWYDFVFLLYGIVLYCCVYRPTFNHTYTPCSKKLVHQAHIDNLVNSQRIFIIPSLAHSLENLR